MSGPHRSVADVRRAVRDALSDLGPGNTVLVAVSGGADSMALASATAFVAERELFQAAAVIIDHQLQPESDAVAQRTADSLHSLGLEPILIRRVTVQGPGGQEAAARLARYAAIDSAASEVGATAVLLGHTLDDQAESVLLGLARGSGAGSIKGMSAVRGRYRRPLLGIERITTRAACEAMSLEVWDDPHNEDASFTRVRVRRRVLPVLESELGPGVAAALARTAALLTSDDEALHEWAADIRAKAQLQVDDATGGGSPQAEMALDVAVLSDAPLAVRSRVVRGALLDAGVPGTDLKASHLQDIDALVTGWRGQGEVTLPGRVRLWRACGRLLIARQAH